MLQHIQDLLGHLSWADAVFFRTWGAAPHTLADEEMCRRTMHQIVTQELFLRLVRGETVRMPDDGPLPSYDDLRVRSRNSAAAYADVSSSLTADNLARTVRVPWFSDPPCDITVAEALTQVVLHALHHRAQNMITLKARGGTPRNVDWVIWLWRGKPAGRWD